MKIKRVVAGVYAANCYILMDEETKESAVIDPGGDVDDIKKAIEDMGAKVKYILLTHGHIDHVGGVDELKKLYDVPVAIQKADEELIHKGTFIFGRLSKRADISIEEGNSISIGKEEVKFIETPGHTIGGVCFLIGDNIFTGDTLFKASIGRTDLESGDSEILIKSIKEKLMVLPDEYNIYPGHGPSSTIGKEKVHNPYIR